jgi:hypothetical protein
MLSYGKIRACRGGDTLSEVYVDIAGDDTEDFGIAAHDIPISPGG